MVSRMVTLLRHGALNSSMGLDKGFGYQLLEGGKFGLALRFGNIHQPLSLQD